MRSVTQRSGLPENRRLLLDGRPRRIRRRDHHSSDLAHAPRRAIRHAAEATRYVGGHPLSPWQAVAVLVLETWQGGRPPFGTRLGDGGFLVEDPEAPQTLRMASEMLLAGLSTQEVSDALNAQGRRPQWSTEWKSSELRRHMRRPHLKGEMTWDGLAITTPSIIDDETWLRVQRTLDSSSLPRRSRRENTDSWPLSGRIACSCGGYLIGVGRRRGARYYRCSNHHGDRRGLCTCDHDANPARPRWSRADDLDVIAWEKLVLVLSNRDALEAAINRSLGRTATGVSDPSIIQRVRRRVASLEAGLVSARADVYGADDEDRDLASRTVGALTERLRSAKDELR